MTRSKAAARPLAFAAVAALMAGCATTAGPAAIRSPTATPRTPAVVRATGDALRTCGKVTASTGVHRKVLTVHLNGPSVMATGQTFHGTVTVSLTPGSGQRSVALSTGSPGLPVIAQGTSIVGEWAGGVAGVGLSGVIAPGHPYQFPHDPYSTFVLLRGCATRVDPIHPDASRMLLRPGRYTLYVSIEDDGPGPNGYLLSQPHPLTITARPTH
jgi:hypothetical protein